MDYRWRLPLRVLSSRSLLQLQAGPCPGGIQAVLAVIESWGAPGGLLGGEQKRQENLEDCDFRRGFFIVWKARRPDSVAWGCKAYCVLSAPGQWALKGAAVLIDARAPGQFPLGCPKIHSTQVPAPARRAVRSSSSYLHHPSPLAHLASFPFFLFHLLFWDSTSFTSSSVSR